MSVLRNYEKKRVHSDSLKSAGVSRCVSRGIGERAVCVCVFPSEVSPACNVYPPHIELRCPESPYGAIGPAGMILAAPNTKSSL